MKRKKIKFQKAGTAATADVTTGPDDTTPGRVWRTDDFDPGDKVDKIRDTISLGNGAMLSSSHVGKRVAIGSSSDTTVFIPLHATDPIPVNAEFYVTGQSFGTSYLARENSDETIIIMLNGVRVGSNLRLDFGAGNDSPSATYRGGILRKVSNNAWTLDAPGVISVSE